MVCLLNKKDERKKEKNAKRFPSKTHNFLRTISTFIILLGKIVCVCICMCVHKLLYPIDNADIIVSILIYLWVLNLEF